MIDIDYKISSYCCKNNITYTRYGDDLTFSSDTKIDYGRLMGYIRTFVLLRGYEINAEKTKIFRQNQYQSVTGIVVNDHLQVSKKYRKKIRQEMYFLLKYNLGEHMAKIGLTMSPKTYINHLLGKINHVLFINGYDKEMLGYREILKGYQCNN